MEQLGLNELRWRGQFSSNIIAKIDGIQRMVKWKPTCSIWAITEIYGDYPFHSHKRPNTKRSANFWADFMTSIKI